MTPEREKEIRSKVGIVGQCEVKDHYNSHSLCVMDDNYLNVMNGIGNDLADLFSEIDSLRSRLADLEAENRWVPVGEKLPDVEGFYITTGPGDWSFLAWFDGISWLNPILNSKINKVTHWRPLPESPEGGK